MGQEPDVARVAAAMNTPGLKYRSFGNLPVRSESPRGDAVTVDPEAVLRELRSSAAAARAAAADPAMAERAKEQAAATPVALMPIMAVPEIEDTLGAYSPAAAPRIRPAALSSEPAHYTPMPTAPTPAPRLGGQVSVGSDTQAPRPAPPLMSPPAQRFTPPPPIPTKAPPATMAAPAVVAPPPSPSKAPPPVRAAPAAVMPPQSSSARAQPPVIVAPAAVMAPPPAPAKAPPPVAAAVMAPPVPAKAAPPVVVVPAVVVAPPRTPTKVPTPVIAPPTTPAATLAPEQPIVATRRLEPVAPTPDTLASLGPLMSDEAAPQAETPTPISGIDWAALASPPSSSAPLSLASRNTAPLQPAGLNPVGPALALAPALAPAQPSARTPPPVPPAPSPPGSAGIPPDPRARTPATSNSPPEDFVLFASIGQAREAPPTPPPPTGSTLSRLRHVIAQSGESILPQPVTATSERAGGPDTYSFGAAASGSMPAAAVTVSLGEVMRLIAASGPPATSPVDTFRAALRSSSHF